MMDAVTTLADREAGPAPNRLDYGEPGDQASNERYVQAWRLWLVLRRDAELTPAEAREKTKVEIARTREIMIGLGHATAEEFDAALARQWPEMTEAIDQGE